MSTPDPAELRDSVRDFRNPATPDWERDYIRSYWAEYGIPNQFAAMLRAAEIEKCDTTAGRPSS